MKSPKEKLDTRWKGIRLMVRRDLVIQSPDMKGKKINLAEKTMKTKKLFTIEEANRRLPLVKKIVDDILDKGQALLKLAKKTDSGELPPESINLRCEIEALMAECEDLGCTYKDWNFQIGLVDFPAVIDGQEVLLCWRSNEEKIQWYHTAEDGYAGRKLIPKQYFSNS